MITLHGLAISNYYNVVKMALLEKGVPFEEVGQRTQSTDDAVLNASPLGKVPFIRTPQGALCETHAILHYLEAAYPASALLPADPYAAGKAWEMLTFIDLHVELVARELYAQAFFGGSVSESTQTRVRKKLEAGVAGLKRLVKFAPFITGEQFNAADIVAFNNLPLVGMASRAIYGEDLLQAGGIDYKPYIKQIGERASAQKVVADRKAATAG